MDVDQPVASGSTATLDRAGSNLPYFTVLSDAPSRAIASISGTDNLISLFGLEATYDRFVRPYVINNEERKPAVEPNGHVAPVDNVQRNRPPRDYGAMLQGLMGTHDYSRDMYFQTAVANPDDPMPPAGIRSFDSGTLRDCFTLQIGQFDGYDHSDWTRTDMPTQHLDQTKAAKKERRIKRKAEAASINGSATNTPSGTPAQKRRRMET